jgi:hypothetical protein
MSGMTGRLDLASGRGQQCAAPTPAERDLLLALQRRALQYFLDNQAPAGLVRDRQANRGRLRSRTLCSTSATGMGLIALALASAPPHRLLSRLEAVGRIEAALKAAARLPHEEGIMPHFVDPTTGRPCGADIASTIDTAWLLAGALWAAAFLGDGQLGDLAQQLYDRVNWAYWSAPDDREAAVLLLHGRGRDGKMLGYRWDRLNGETVFLYVLAAGAVEGRAWPASSWDALRPAYGLAAGHRFNNADLGLFVFQYGLDLLNLAHWRIPGAIDLSGEASIAAAANRDVCRAASARFSTYRRYWGLSAGDGPGDPPARSTYRAYAPGGPIDGTAHLTAALASVGHQPDAVFANLHAARSERALAPLGRYGLSSINLDRRWIAPDMVGIDAGAAILALDNLLEHNRVRGVFHELPNVARGLTRLGVSPRGHERQAS